MARSKQAIEKRLEYVNEAGVDKIMPWMVKCDEQTLERYIIYEHVAWAGQIHRTELKRILIETLELGTMIQETMDWNTRDSKGETSQTGYSKLLE